MIQKVFGLQPIRDAFMLLFSGALKIGEEMECCEYRAWRYTIEFLGLDMRNRIERSYWTWGDGWKDKIDMEARYEGSKVILMRNWLYNHGELQCVMVRNGINDTWRIEERI